MKKSTIAIICMAVALSVTASSAAIQTVNAEKHKRKVYSSYSKSFYELTEHTEKIHAALKKAALTTDSHSLLSIGATIRESAAFAISDLSEMEADTPLTNISTFLNQAGDFVKATALAHSDGSSPEKSEQETFMLLSRFAEILANELHYLREKIASGEISYSAAISDADHTLGEHLSQIETEHFSSYEALNYDGAFSAHMEDTKSQYLTSFPEMTKEEALTIALSYLSGEIPLIYKGELSGNIPSYSFYLNTPESSYSMEVSKKGGKLLYYSESRIINDSKITTEEALFHAKAFAEQSGYKDIRPVFYKKAGGTFIVTMAPVSEEVVFYPDLLKIEVALDDASVIGFYAKDYLMNHKNRTFPDVSEKAYDVLAGMNSAFLLKSLNKCFIPTEYNSEIPCLEAMGTFENQTYLIYLNAESGIQEEILLLSLEDGEYSAI